MAYGAVNIPGMFGRMASAASPGGPLPNVSGSYPAGMGGTDFSGLASWMNGQTNQNLGAGQTFANGYFGRNNPQVAQIEDAEQQQMKGFSQAQINAMRDQGTSQINSQVGTGMHALAGMNSAKHIAGGAAAAGAMPLLNNANTQQAQLANNINVANIAQQNAGLGNYQSTVTNERAGGLNTALGVAGLGSANTFGAMQYGLGRDYLDWAQQNLAASPGPGSSGSNGGPGSKFGSMMQSGYGAPILSSDNDATGVAGGSATAWKGGNPTANTPFSGGFYKNMDTNPANLGSNPFISRFGNNMTNPFPGAPQVNLGF